MSVPKDEASKIYYTIFNKDIPESIKNHFEYLSKRIESNFSEQEKIKYHECILKIHDLEALELAARYFKKLPILTLKFKVILYLAETLPQNYSKYINEKNNFFIGSLLLVFSMVRTSYKLVKGICLLVINRL